MNLDPSVVVTAISTVSNALASVKTARELAKSTDSNELKKAVGDAFDAVLDLKAQVHELSEENRSLREQMQQRAKIHHVAQNGLFYEDGNETPLCPKCWQGQGKPVYLRHPRPGDSDWFCDVCVSHYSTEPRRQYVRSVSGGPNSWMG